MSAKIKRIAMCKQWPEAEELLPCTQPNDCKLWVMSGDANPHAPECKAHERPALAAALEARDKRIGELEQFKAKYHEAMDIMSEWKNIDSAAAVAENRTLRAELAALKAQPAEHSPWDKPCEHQATQFSYPTGDILITKAWCLPCVSTLGRAFDEMRGEVERMKGKEG